MDSEKHSNPSCTSGLTRKEFIKKILERGASAGVLAIAATEFSLFRPAPALAKTSGGITGPTGPTGATGSPGARRADNGGWG